MTKPPPKPNAAPKPHRAPRGGRPGARSAARTWSPGEGRIVLYGLHSVAAALENPLRAKHRLVATHNAVARLEERGIALALAPEIVDPRVVAEMVPDDAVHQGIALVTEPLPAGARRRSRRRPPGARLDQVTDPHNVGAILRSAVALGADALIVTARHSPQETGVLAKAASGAVDLLPQITVGSLPRALAELKEQGFTVLGLDSEAEHDLETVPLGAKAVLVLGSEGKGLRAAVAAETDAVARLAARGRSFRSTSRTPPRSPSTSSTAASAPEARGRRRASAAFGRKRPEAASLRRRIDLHAVRADLDLERIAILFVLVVGVDPGADDDDGENGDDRVERIPAHDIPLKRRMVGLRTART